MKILGPKFVNKSGAWCVTVFKQLTIAKGTKTHTQTQNWFSTEEEAKTFIKEQEGKN